MDETNTATEVKPWRMVSTKTAIFIAIVIILVALGFAYKGLFIAATVNGNPISRFAVIERLERSSGKEVLDSLITEKLIERALNEKSVTVTSEEVSARVKTIQEQVAKQGIAFEDALKNEEMSEAEFREQITTQMRVEKMFEDRVQVSDEEVAKYIKENKVTIPKGEEIVFKSELKNQLKSGKLNQIAGEWVTALRAGASVNYFAY